MKVLICFSTYSEWIKLKPLIKLMDNKEYKLFFTGQYSDLLSKVKVDYTIKLPKPLDNSLNSIMAECMLQFPTSQFDTVLLQGNSSATLGCALAAYNKGIRTIHLEAGLRTQDIIGSYPEEGYRQMISRITELNFCPTTTSLGHLISERVEGDGFVIGNSILDNLVEHESKREYTNQVLVTLHKIENHKLLDIWFKKINEIALNNPNLEFIFPIHPLPIIKKYKYLLPNIKIINILPHDKFLKILLKCKLVITDSGGVMQEASYFNKKVIVCKKTSEYPEGFYSGHLHLCSTPENLPPLFNKLIKDYKIQIRCPYGEGRTSENIYEIIKRSVPHFNKLNNI
jgi:UDP-N-acetylglucosamine 2-epimerase (non-hydrolysing)